MKDFLNKTPLKIEFNDSFGQKEEFVSRISKIHRFLIRTPVKNYFSRIVEAIFNDEDPMQVMEKHIPEDETIPHMEIYVKSPLTTAQSQKIIFDYDPDWNDDEFYDSCKSAENSYFTKMKRAISGNYGISVIKGLFGTSVNANNILGDAFFVNKEYEKALVVFTNFSRQEKNTRMIELCKALLGHTLTNHFLSTDILLLYLSEDKLYEVAESLPFEQAIAIKYYLLGRNLPVHRRLLLSYACCQGFIEMKYRKNFENCKKILLNETNCKIANKSGAEYEFWRDLKGLLDGELNYFERNITII